MTDQSKSWSNVVWIALGSDLEQDLAAIEDFGTLLMILLAQPDADSAVQQMHRVAGLIVCYARAMQSRRDRNHQRG